MPRRTIDVLFSVFAVILGLAGPAARAEAPEAPANHLELRATYAPAVREAAPAVVNIYTKRVVTQRMRTVFDDPFFRDFLGGGMPGGMTRQRIQSSLGSGVIVDQTGIVVTNNHVVENAGAIKLVLADRREFEAEILLTDPQTDLAVLRIPVEGELPVLDFADSDTAQVGDIVLAIGNPFGVGQTVTSGIVSAQARTAASVSDFQFFIQTDAAINPGNSGGALVDVDGKLLGVNTAIYSRSGGSNGIGFAIPANLVHQVVTSAISGDGHVRRPWLGVQGTTVDAAMAQAVGLDRPRGAIVGEVFKGGPADRGGLREGDVVLRIAGKDVFAAEALRYRPATMRVGETVAIDVLRDGKERTLKVKLTYPPETPSRHERKLTGTHPLSGITIANLSPALNEELGRSPMSSGVVVLSTEPGSIASRYRLGRNVVLLNINGVDITKVEDVERAVTKRGRVFQMAVADSKGRVSRLQVSR